MALLDSSSNARLQTAIHINQQFKLQSAGGIRGNWLSVYSVPGMKN